MDKLVLWKRWLAALRRYDISVGCADGRAWLEVDEMLDGEWVAAKDVEWIIDLFGSAEKMDIANAQVIKGSDNG